MAHADFVHLHLHTEYSLLDGALPFGPADGESARAQVPGLGDHGPRRACGAIDFYRAAGEKASRRSSAARSMSRLAAASTRKTSTGGRDVYHHLVLLAKDEAGYKNLIKLSTAAHLEVITTSRASTKNC